MTDPFETPTEMKMITPRTSPTTGRRGGRLALALSLTAIAALTLSACSSSEEPRTAAPESDAPSPAAPEGASGMPMPSGVSGLIADAREGQLQVQGSGSQTTVRYSDDTTISTTVSADVAELQVGDCVLIVSGENEIATSISVTAAVDGECGIGSGLGGFPGGGFPGGGFPEGGELPEGGFPDDLPEGAPGEGFERGAPPEGFEGGPGGFGGFGGFTAGTVTALSDDLVTVDAIGADGELTSAAIAVDASTVLTTTVDGSADDIAVGLCVSAQGEADSAGGYDATSLTLSEPGEDGQCGGVGGFRGGFGGGPSGERGGNSG